MQDDSLKQTVSINPVDGDGIENFMESRGGRIVRLDTGDATLLDPLAAMPEEAGKQS